MTKTARLTSPSPVATVLAAVALLAASRAQAQSPQTPLQQLLRAHGGQACVLERKAAAVGIGTEAPFDPDADPAAAPSAPAARYEPTQDAVFKVCAGLGCVDDPASDDPSHGVCALPKSVADCAGAAEPAQHGGLCGPAHLELPAVCGSYGRRFMFTAQALVELGPDLGRPAEIDTAVGALFQLSLTRSKARKMADGGDEHFDLPRLYLHLEAHISKQRVGHELGLVYKLGGDIFTRAAVTAYGIVWGAEQFVAKPQYRLGAAVHVELLSNLLVRAAFTPGLTAKGPSWVLGAEYAANLWSDFKE